MRDSPRELFDRLLVDRAVAAPADDGLIELLAADIGAVQSENVNDGLASGAAAAPSVPDAPILEVATAEAAVPAHERPAPGSP